MNNPTVKCFKWVRGVNDAEYIELLLDALDRQKKITAKAIDKLKKVDAVSVKHGKWITKSNPNYSPFDPCSSEELHICNQCGYEQEFGTNYCANCGAKMDGERKDDE